MANLYCELQIRDVRLQKSNDDKCSLQEKIKALEADRPEVGELKYVIHIFQKQDYPNNQII